MTAGSPELLKELNMRYFEVFWWRWLYKLGFVRTKRRGKWIR